jgi:hypothetical protein
MSMTRKGYVAMAIEMGALIRWCDHAGSDEISAAQRQTVERAINAFCRVAQADNSAFDKGQFVDFTYEVARGERDLEGKKVKVSK